MVLKLSDVNTKDWAHQDKWDVRIKTGEGLEGYTNWIPATSVTSPIFNISSFDWSSGHRTFSLPKALDYPNISMTLIDDEDRTVKRFLRTWCETAFPESGGIQYLSEIIKTLEIVQLTEQNIEVEIESYIVFPVGSTASALTSDPGVLSYNVEFKIAGYKRR